MFRYLPFDSRLPFHRQDRYRVIVSKIISSEADSPFLLLAQFDIMRRILLFAVNKQRSKAFLSFIVISSKIIQPLSDRDRETFFFIIAGRKKGTNLSIDSILRRHIDRINSDCDTSRHTLAFNILQTERVFILVVFRE